jgi:hypothetical protein
MSLTLGYIQKDELANALPVGDFTSVEAFPGWDGGKLF